MRRAAICLWMMIKRMGKHPAYWGLFALFPAALFLVPKFNRAVDEERISVGYVVEIAKPMEAEKSEYLQEEEKRQEYGRQLLEGIEYKLSEEGNGNELFRYIKYSDESEMIEDILTGELSGGVLFDEKFAEKFRKQDYYQCIHLYLPRGMNAGGMVREDIFGRVYQAGSAVWYAELLEGQGYRIEPEEVLGKFAEYQEQGRVFSVNYEVQTEGGGEVQSTVENGKEMQALSLRGVLAFLVFLAACLGALDSSRDRKKGAGKGIASSSALTMATVLAPILPAVLFLAGAMVPGKMPEEILSEFCSALLYGFILWITAVFFSRTLPGKVLEGAMPCFLLTTLLCCPVFFDPGETIPLIGYLSKVFPLTWYLNFWG